jgi:hypothetical protein
MPENRENRGESGESGTDHEAENRGQTLRYPQNIVCLNSILGRAPPGIRRSRWLPSRRSLGAPASSRLAADPARRRVGGVGAAPKTRPQPAVQSFMWGRSAGAGAAGRAPGGVEPPLREAGWKPAVPVRPGSPSKAIFVGIPQGLSPVSALSVSALRRLAEEGHIKIPVRCLQ